MTKTTMRIDGMQSLRVDLRGTKVLTQISTRSYQTIPGV